MVGTEFFDVTIATDDHNEVTVSVEPRQGILVVNNGSISGSYVEVIWLIDSTCSCYFPSSIAT